MAKTISLNRLSPELRAQAEKEIEKQEKAQKAAVREIDTIHKRMSKKALRVWERMTKTQQEYYNLILELIDARERYYELQPSRKKTDTISFVSEDKLFRVQLITQARKALNSELATKAKELIDAYIKEVREKSDIPPEIEELINLLEAMFESRNKRLSYNWGIHNFLAGSYSDPRISQAQDILREAMEDADISYRINFYSRSRAGEKWQRLPINWFLTANAANDLLERMKSERAKRRRKKTKQESETNKQTAA